jgi:hypothetical protein
VDYVKSKVYATKVYATKVTGLGMSSQQSVESSCWFAHGKNWNFDRMFSMRHKAPTINYAARMEKSVHVIHHIKISFTFLLATYNF